MCEIVNFEIAKKLKEKGFDGRVNNHYKTTNKIYNTGIASDFNILTGIYSAPTISQVLKWLREKDIMVEIPVDLGDNGVWQFTFRIQTKKFYERATKCDYTSYESAALSCIEYIIDNLI